MANKLHEYPNDILQAQEDLHVIRGRNREWMRLSWARLSYDLFSQRIGLTGEMEKLRVRD